jgi:aminoglycoside/choline kinase family phosphotransferase
MPALICRKKEWLKTGYAPRSARWRLENEISLTPSQRAFIRAFYPDFSMKRWETSLAGQAGSSRTFVRIGEKIETGRSCILVIWDSSDEDWPRFLSIPDELSLHLSLLPKIYHADARHGLILEEDLGNETLKRFCEQNPGPEEIEAAFRKTIDALAAWHRLDVRLSATISSRALDFETFMWETDYFARRCVIDFCGAERLLTKEWEKERKTLAAQAAALPQCFVHRDFQSENIMFVNGTIKFVDFQGARLGPPAYDLASLLYDPYLNVLNEIQIGRLFAWYGTHRNSVDIDRHAFDLCAAQRLMQALGAYGNLSIHHGKTRYRAFVPVALERLCRVLERLPEYPEMAAIARGCHETVLRTIEQ